MSEEKDFIPGSSDAAVYAPLPGRPDSSHSAGFVRMDREQMADWLGLPKRGDERERILNAITPAEWAEHEAFAAKVAAILRWEQGLGPLPAGVIACGRRSQRSRP